MRLQAFVSDEIQAEIDRRAASKNGGIGRSQIVEESLDRYFYILAHGRRMLRSKLSAPELGLIADTCNGTIWQSFSIPVIDHRVSDAIQLDGADEKWGVDGAKLIATLTNLTMDEYFALADAVERFWLGVSNNKGAQPHYANILDEPADDGPSALEPS